MAKIILVGQDDIELSREKAKKIKKDWNAGKFNKDDKIEVGQNSVKAGDIRSIRISKKSKDEETKINELSTREIKNRLGDFEEKLEEIKSGELKTYNRIGIMDSGVMEDLLLGWAVTEEDGRYKIRPDEWEAFSKNASLLKELKYRREYAEEQENEQLEQLAESR